VIAGAVEKYLNRKDIRRQLGVSESVTAFETCNEKTEQEFARRGDQWISTTNQVVYLLDKGVSILIFAGEYDWIWYIPTSSDFF
jgi:Serine carboxypeptidase